MTFDLCFFIKPLDSFQGPGSVSNMGSEAIKKSPKIKVSKQMFFPPTCAGGGCFTSNHNFCTRLSHERDSSSFQ